MIHAVSSISTFERRVRMKENSKAKEMDIFGLMGLINASFNNIRGLVEFKYWSFSTNFLSIEKPKDAKSISKNTFPRSTPQF